MVDYISIGPTPCNEECAQVGDPDYIEKAREECQRFLKLIRERIGPEPEGARLAIKSFPHDFGNYLEVVCFYNNEISQKYALKCEAETPSNW